LSIINTNNRQLIVDCYNAGHRPDHLLGCVAFEQVVHSALQGDPATVRDHNANVLRFNCRMAFKRLFNLMLDIESPYTIADPLYLARIDLNQPKGDTIPPRHFGWFSTFCFYAKRNAKVGGTAQVRE
jgi:hypothetical protein